MSMAPGGFYPVSSAGTSTSTSTSTNTNVLAQTIHCPGALYINSRGVLWQKPDGNSVDISKAAEIFWFFLAQHPEIVEQFNAIEKIKQS